jgi:beta-1,2-mannosidase
MSLSMFRVRGAAAAACCLIFGLSSIAEFNNIFRNWKRVSETPILSPQGTEWQSAGTFNPAVIIRNGKFVMLYRAQDARGTSRLGYAESGDGIHFERMSTPVLAAEADYEKGGGVEDPRLVRLDDRYYLTYTAYNGKDAQLCLAESTDLIIGNGLA